MAVMRKAKSALKLILSAAMVLNAVQLRAQSIRVEYVRPAATANADPSSIIFHDDLSHAPNSFGPSPYFEYDPADGSFVWSAAEGMGGGGAMRCLFRNWQVSAGSLKLLFGGSPFNRGLRRSDMFREIYWRIYVKHQSGWTGNPAKLGRTTCLAAPNWSQGFIAHVWGGKGDALCIDPASGVTDSHRILVKYNDFDHLRWLGLRNGETPIFSARESGRWVCVESHVRLNTPGKQDGVFELMIDGKLEAARNDLDWQGPWNEYGINAVFIENYWNSGSVKEQARWFDDFVVSTRPIGPITAEAVPQLRRTQADGIKTWQAQVALDAEGHDIVWTSRPALARDIELRGDTARGAFGGSCEGKTLLPRGRLYWVRLRENAGAATQSEWTTWHAPFRTP